MSFTLVQSTGAGAANPTFGSSVTVGNLIVVWVGNNYTGTPFGSDSVSDNKGNTYTQAYEFAFGGGTHVIASIWYSVATTGGSGLQVTYTPVAGTHVSAAIAEYSFSGTLAVESFNGAGGNSTSLASGAFSTSNANDLLVGIGTAGASTGQTWTAGSGWGTPVYTNAGSSGVPPICAMHQVNAAAGSYNANMTDTTSSTWSSVGVAFSARFPSMAAIEGGDVFSATALEATSASASATESHDTASIVGHFSDLGSIAVTNSGDSFSGSAKFTDFGTIAKTEAHDSFAGSAAFATSATASPTESHDVFAGTAAGPSASMAATESHDVFAGVSGIADHATFTPTEHGDIMSSFAMVSPFLRAREGGDIFAGSAAATGCVGTIAVTNASDTFAGTAGFTYDTTATLHPTEQRDVFSAIETETSSAAIATHEHGDSFAGHSAFNATAILGPTEGGDQFHGGFQSVAYHVYWNSGSGSIDYTSAIDTTAGLTYTTSPLAFPATYQFGVRAFYVLGGLEEQNVDAVVTIVLDGMGNDITSRPLAPLGLRCFALAAGTLRAEWTIPPSSPAKAPTGFHVYSGTGLSPNYGTIIATVLASSGINNSYVANMPGFSDGVTYRIGVRSYNATAEESNVNFVSVVADSTGPSAVTNLTAIATS